LSQWCLQRACGEAHELFASSLDLLATVEQPTVRILVPSTAVLVLGSAQRADIVGLGVSYVHRRSGGGAVWLDPANQVWVDVLLPANHPRWTDDIRRSVDWLGHVWWLALTNLGVPSASMRVHAGGLERSKWSSLLCFAGVGPGEVLIGPRKVVGISQRRSRRAALFQCGALLDWSFDPMVFAAQAWPGVPDVEVMQAGVGLRSILGASLSGADVEQALMDALVAAS